MRHLQAHMAMLSLLVVAVAFPLPARDTPESAVRRFLSLVAAADWRGAAELVRPRALDGFRNTALSGLVSSAETRVRLLGGRVAPPRPYGRLAPMADRLAFLDTVPVTGLSRPFTVGELARLPAVELLAEALARRCAGTQPPEIRVLGAVIENDSTGWALLRRVIPNAPPDFPTAAGIVSVAPLHRHPDGWLLGYATGSSTQATSLPPFCRARGG